ncbi:MAG: cell division protein FtsZ [Candidatus Anstonellaceae archaeon]
MVIDPVDKIAEQISQQKTSTGNSDEELLAFLEQTKPKILVVGTGGSGCNTLNRMIEVGIEGATLIAMNTDVRHLIKIKADKKILLGKMTTKGMGAGSNPLLGENAAKESQEEIKKTLNGASMVFIACGLGGGTGTGSAHIIAEVARQVGALTVAVVTLPFASEGKIRMQNALEGLEKLKRHADTVIIIPNDKLLSVAPDLPLNTAFKVCDEVLTSAVKSITELVTKAGLVNLDFADLKTILSSAGCAVVGVGESTIDAKPEDRALLAAEMALNSPLLDVDISQAQRALINVIGGEDMSLKEAELIVNTISKRIDPNAHIIWGARIEKDSKKNRVRVLTVVAGTKFPKYDLNYFQNKEFSFEDMDLDLVV